MKKGKIVFLNGVSSTGKSTLSKILLQKLDEPYHWLNVDTFITFTDMRKNPATYFEDGKDPVSIFPHVLKLYSDLGVNVIADVAFMKWDGPRMFKAEETMNKCIEMLHEYPVLYVHVTCPYGENQRRHIERGDRGTKHDFTCHENHLVGDCNGIYDLTVNTHDNTTENCADQIIALLNNETNFKAFESLWLEKGMHDK